MSVALRGDNIEELIGCRSCAERSYPKLALLDPQAASTSDKQPVGLHASHFFGAEPHVNGSRAQSAGGVRQPHCAASDRDGVGCQHATSTNKKAAGLHAITDRSWMISGDFIVSGAHASILDVMINGFAASLALAAALS